MPERERPLCREEQKPEAPLFSREPLIELPDRNISLIYLNHGKSSEPFPDRETFEREILAVFRGKIDAILLDSFPPIESMASAPTILLESLSYPEDKLDFERWFIRYAAEKGTTIIGADPYPRAGVLFRKLIEDEDKFFENYFAEEYVPNSVKFSPEYKDLKSRANLVAALHSGLDFLFGLQLFVMAKKLGEITPRQAVNRREFMGWAFRTSAALFSLSAENFLIKAEDTLKDYEYSQDPILEANEDSKKLIEFFSKGVEISQRNFDDPSFQRRIFLNERDFAKSGLRNALVAEALTLPIEEILPWTSSRANIVATYGLDHEMVPENMRISFFIKNEEARKEYIKYMTGFLAFRSFGQSGTVLAALRGRLAEGASYKINKDGTYLKHKFKLNLT